MSGTAREQDLTTVAWAKAPKSLAGVSMRWGKVDKSAGPTACWPWFGTINAQGYGVFSVGTASRGTKRQVRAHRAAWAAVHGDPPLDMVLDHLCRNRACCNPAHMELVAHGENVHRSVHQLKATCVNGHPRDAENVILDKLGRRRGCRACNRERMSKASPQYRPQSAQDGGVGCPGQLS